MSSDKFDLEGINRERMAEAAVLGVLPPPAPPVMRAVDLAPAIEARPEPKPVRAVGGSGPNNALSTEFLTLAEAGEVLRLSRAGMFRRLKNGKLPAFREGNRTLVRRADVLALICPATR